MTIFKLIKLTEIIKDESSRASAAEAYRQIESLLGSVDRIEIDLSNLNFTPSVADEVFGELVINLSPQFFKQKIKIINASESNIALIRHVIARRLGQLKKST